MTIEGQKTVGYLGLVSGEAILGADIFRDLIAGRRDIVGGSGGRNFTPRKDKGRPWKSTI